MQRPFQMSPDLAAVLRRSLAEGSRLMEEVSKRIREDHEWLYRPTTEQKEKP